MRTVAGQRDQGRLTGQAVVDKNIYRTIDIAADQVGGKRAEGHENPNRRDDAFIGAVISLLTSAGNRNPGCLAGLKVVNKNILRPVGITSHQVAGIG